MKTTIGIIGGGPAGLLLSYLLDRMGVDNCVLEHRSRTHVENRVRAGQMDHSSVAFLRGVGLGARMDKEGMPQRGVNLRYRDETRRIDLEDVTGGRYCTVYGQSELTRDLIAALVGSGHSPIFNAENIQLSDPDTTPHAINFMLDGSQLRLECQYLVGADGAHGPTRQVVLGTSPGDAKQLPFSWIGVLSQTPPISDELTYVYHPGGFALWSMRSKSVSRTYLQCSASDRLEDWSDDRFWTEMRCRLGPETDFNPGPTTERVLVRMQGYVASRMRRGNVVLAGDAGHIVPPSAAKGLNLAIADVAHLATAFRKLLFGNDQNALSEYGDGAMRRAWAGQHFSWQMTDLFHAAPDGDAFENNLKLTQLDSLLGSSERLRLFCDAYVGAEAL